jgi:hypothetical protein
MAIFNTLITKSRFIRLRIAQPITRRECNSNSVRTQPTHADIYNITQANCWKRIPVLLDELGGLFWDVPLLLEKTVLASKPVIFSDEV